MDFMGALSGLERIAIIGGAMLVGYWGFRLFATDRTPALVFMGIACAVLFGALFTGGSHVKIVGESYQLASAHPVEPMTQAEAPAVEPVAADSPTQAPETTPQPVAPADEAVVEAAPKILPETSEPIIAVATTDETTDLLSSQELGGRIVSVKSGSVSLEWSRRQQP